MSKIKALWVVFIMALAVAFTTFFVGISVIRTARATQLTCNAYPPYTCDERQRGDGQADAPSSGETGDTGEGEGEGETGGQCSPK